MLSMVKVTNSSKFKLKIHELVDANYTMRGGDQTCITVGGCFDDLIWVMGLEVLLNIILLMVFCRKGKYSV